jgi:hypothetical protein
MRKPIVAVTFCPLVATLARAAPKTWDGGTLQTVKASVATGPTGRRFLHLKTASQ